MKYTSGLLINRTPRFLSQSWLQVCQHPMLHLLQRLHYIILYGARYPSEHTANFDRINLRTSTYLFVPAGYIRQLAGDVLPLQLC